MKADCDLRATSIAGDNICDQENQLLLDEKGREDLHGGNPVVVQRKAEPWMWRHWQPDDTLVHASDGCFFVHDYVIIN